MGGEKITQEFEINDDHAAWLTTIAGKYNLPDASKALRVLIDFAQSDGDPDLIFNTIRCNRCG